VTPDDAERALDAACHAGRAEWRVREANRKALRIGLRGRLDPDANAAEGKDRPCADGEGLAVPDLPSGNSESLESQVSQRKKRKENPRNILGLVVRPREDIFDRSEHLHSLCCVAGLL